MRALTLAAKAATYLFEGFVDSKLEELSLTPGGLVIEGLVHDAEASLLHFFKDGSSLIVRQNEAPLSTLSLDATGTGMLLKNLASRVEAQEGKGFFSSFLAGSGGMGFNIDRAKLVLAEAKSIPALAPYMEQPKKTVRPVMGLMQ